MEGNNKKICKDCQAEYELTPGEEEFYKGIMAKDPAFRMPVRCAKCRQAKKMQRLHEREKVVESTKTPLDEFKMDNI